MIRFVDEHRNRFCVEFICKTLNTHREGGFLSSRGYRQSKARGLSARALRDAALVEHLRDVHAENYGVYGVRKMCRVLRRQGIGIGRERTAWLCAVLVCPARTKVGAPITTRKPKGSDLQPDLVNREFRPLALIGCGWRTLPTCAPGKGSCKQLSSLMCTPGRLSGGRCRLSMRAEAFAAADAQPGDHVCQGNNGLGSPFRPRLEICEPWSKTSAWLSTEVLCLPPLLVFPMTMLWLRTSTAPTKMS